jgi:IMP dehydrogenase
MNTALTYDDIQLVPKFSDIPSRKIINLTSLITRRFGVMMPLVASPMDTVCDYEMAIRMADIGGVGIIHRFMSIEEQSRQVNLVFKHVYCPEKAIFEDWGLPYDDWH